MKTIHLHTQCHRKPVVLVIFVLVMQHIAVTAALHSSEYSGNETDHAALLAIKTQLVDHPNGVLGSWNNSFHHCNWEGVVCERKYNRVTQLDLRSRGLAGTISPFIGNLSFLRNISFYNNSLSGHIPETLGLLRRLNVLWLFNNTLTGEIPANISSCVNLRSISFANNKLQGRLPAGFRALSKLEQISVKNNNLTGSFFDIIQNLTSLEIIYAAYNSFTGTIPSNIGRMQNLVFLEVEMNQLTGTFPASIFNLSSLQHLELSYNNLHGKIPEHTGKVPQSFGHLSNLAVLALAKNYLDGDINFITTLVNCSNLNVLSLEENNFSGILPKTVANLSTTLTWLSIGNSLISGMLPAGITNLINLERLIMVNTDLTASLPHDFGKLQKLQEVRLSSNRLTGKIPDSVGNLSRLTILYIDNNKLSGSIPESIGNCQSLLYLNLQNNTFFGHLSRKLFSGYAKYIYLSLSRNQLEGSIPLEISKQINLIYFDVSENKLSGVVPDSLGDCLDLQYLYLDGNSFHGNIPQSIKSLSSLIGIDVSQNHLSGEIPAYLSKFPLIYLNLSYNDFEGRIPTDGVFANASGVFLVGNDMLCGGIQALRLPRCVEEKIRNKRSLSYTLKKVVIITVCALVAVLAMLLGLFLVIKKNKRRLISETSITREKFTPVSYAMLLKATSGFSSDNLLGAGSFGSVFTGVLNTKIIAVKVLNMQHHGASKSFIAECKALKNVRHRNLVGIVTACSSIDYQRNDFRALVYEFMPNGSVDRWLHGGAGKLSLAQRVDIAIDVSHALNYIHHECETPIIHCDLKPSNILLDNDMVAHVGDFGISKFLTQPPHPNESSTVGIRGTIGYAAPEYGLGSEASTVGDVYSYGILLLELITGKSPTDNMFKDDYNLHMYAKEALPDQVLQILDPTLDEDYQTTEADNRREIHDDLQRRIECIISVINVGVSCSHHLPNHRMKIPEAKSRLQSARDDLLNARKRRKIPAQGTTD